MNILYEKLKHCLRQFTYSTVYTSANFASEMNQALDDYPTYAIVNRRDRTKKVIGFQPTNVDNKILVRYETGRNSNMLIRNIVRNLMVFEEDIWDDPDEDMEQDMLLQRMGIKV